MSAFRLPGVPTPVQSTLAASAPRAAALQHVANTTPTSLMAEQLARVFGTEEDPVNCAFYFKVGVCRHGELCSKKHNKPLSSRTLLLTNMYPNTPEGMAIGMEHPWDEDMYDRAQQHLEAFYEEVVLVMADYGEIEEVVVVENTIEYMMGNVYVKFYYEEDASKALVGLTGRFYFGRLINAEYTPVTDFREARCRAFHETYCTRGGACRFLHIRHIPTAIKRRVAREMYKEHPEYTKPRKRHRSRSRKRRRSPGQGYENPPPTQRDYRNQPPPASLEDGMRERREVAAAEEQPRRNARNRHFADAPPPALTLQDKPRATPDDRARDRGRHSAEASEQAQPATREEAPREQGGQPSSDTVPVPIARLSELERKLQESSAILKSVTTRKPRAEPVALEDGKRDRQAQLPPPEAARDEQPSRPPRELEREPVDPGNKEPRPLEDEPPLRRDRRRPEPGDDQRPPMLPEDRPRDYRITDRGGREEEPPLRRDRRGDPRGIERSAAPLEDEPPPVPHEDRRRDRRRDYPDEPAPAVDDPYLPPQPERRRRRPPMALELDDELSQEPMPDRRRRRHREPGADGDAGGVPDDEPFGDRRRRRHRDDDFGAAPGDEPPFERRERRRHRDEMDEENFGQEPHPDSGYERRRHRRRHRDDAGEHDAEYAPEDEPYPDRRRRRHYDAGDDESLGPERRRRRHRDDDGDYDPAMARKRRLELQFLE